MHDSRPDPHRLGQDLDEAVRLHLRSDVPVGLFLSGGLDSAGLLGLMHRHVGTVRTFTVGYESGGRAVRDETRPAAAAAARAAAAHRELRLSAREWWTALEQAVVAEDEPIANPSMVSLHALAAAASRDVRVVLNGTGGDELFGGYPAHRDLPRCLDRHAARRGRAPSWPGRVVPRAIGAVEAAYPFLRRWPGLARFPKHLSRARSAWLTADEACRRLASFEWLTLTDAQRRRLYGPDLTRAWHDGDTARAYRAVFDDSRAASDDTRDQAQALVMRTWLPGNGLLSLDKVTMAHGLEARVPYLDRVFMERVMRLDAATRLQRGKALLAGALHGVLPAELLVRPKQPFETPIDLWFDRDLADDVRAVILDPGARIRALFRMDAVERVLRRQAARRVGQVELIFRLLVLELWWRRVLQA
jgi:asparagine synthase (glutamine-hydrolysing)